MSTCVRFSECSDLCFPGLCEFRSTATSYEVVISSREPSSPRPPHSVFIHILCISLSVGSSCWSWPLNISATGSWEHVLSNLNSQIRDSSPFPTWCSWCSLVPPCNTGWFRFLIKHSHTNLKPHFRMVITVHSWQWTLQCHRVVIVILLFPE